MSHRSISSLRIKLDRDQAERQIFAAIKSNNVDAVEALVPLNTINVIGRALEYAVILGDMACVKPLSNSALNIYKQQALVQAAMHENIECVAYLVEKVQGLDNDAILWSILRKNKDIFHLLYPVSDVTLIMDDLTSDQAAFVHICLAEQERSVIMDCLPDAPRSRLNKKM